MLKINDISLRQVSNADADFLFQGINNPNLVHFNAPYRPVHEVSHLKWLEALLVDTTKELFIIELKGEPVGTVQLIDISSIHRNAELTIRIFDQKNRGNNIGSNVLHLISSHAFDNLGLMRLWLRVFSNNEQAIRSYKKAGFMHEGVMRQAAYIKGAFLDVVIMGKINDSV